MIVNSFSLSRSGNHPFVRWLLMSCQEPQYLVMQGTRPWQGKRIFNNEIQLVKQDEFYPDSYIRGLFNIDITKMDEYWKSDTNVVPASLNIVFLRDLYNNLASFLKFIINNSVQAQVLKQRNEITVDKLTFLWESYAKEFIGETNYLGGAYPVEYDSWFKLKSYRIFLCNKFSSMLGVNFISNEEIISKIPDRGLGSSFDKFDRYKNSARQMDLLNRKNFLLQEVDGIEDFFKDRSQLVELNEKIFGTNIFSDKPVKKTYDTHLSEERFQNIFG